jgi:dolichol-phosphate mannosyltransferase
MGSQDQSGQALERLPELVSGCILVLPTYNEAANLPVLLDRLWKVLPGMHVLIVDDNSPDGTGELADDLVRRWPERVRILHRPQKDGLGRAYVAGFRLALEQGYQRIAQMDADLSHDPAALPALLEALRGADLVLGSRYAAGGGIEGWRWHRRILSRTANRFARWALGAPFADLTGGFKVWRADALRSIGLERVCSRGYLFLIETTMLCARNGGRIREAPIVFRDRHNGRSKLGGAVIGEAVWGILTMGARRFWAAGSFRPPR